MVNLYIYIYIYIYICVCVCVCVCVCFAVSLATLYSCSANLCSLTQSVSLSLNGEEPFCRICHEGLSAGDLLSPCECAGTLAMVHRVCLEHWLTASGTSHCELCHFEFALERLPKPFTEWLATPSMQRRTLCGDVICFLFITPLASLSGWLCVQGALDLYYSNGMEAFGLLMLTLALFTIYLFWTVVTLSLQPNEKRDTPLHPSLCACGPWDGIGPC
uniref:RING-CH-type domain-containing protein n=1 Tax=Astyanax mexicanus TaxID=7994 RepID=A0A8B9K1Y4_ASTMX